MQTAAAEQQINPKITATANELLYKKLLVQRGILDLNGIYITSPTDDPIKNQTVNEMDFSTKAVVIGTFVAIVAIYLYTKFCWY